jgi:hypothetical protein
MKICFTTALFGDPKTLDKPAKFERNPNYDYFLFTDINEEHFDTSWDVINIKDNPNISSLTSNVRKSRYPKFMSWELLESMGKNYDVVFYCDGFYIPNFNKNWEKNANLILKEKKFPVLQSNHKSKKVRTGGIISELKNIKRCWRDKQEALNKTKLFFEKYDKNVNLYYPQFFENTCFGYSFKNENVRNITNEFWKIYTTEDITYRDQPLWNFLLLRHKYTPIIVNNFKTTSPKNRIKKNFYFLGLNKMRGTMRNDYNKI